MIRRALLSIALLAGLACAEDYSILMSPTNPDAAAVASELGSFSSSRPISSTSDTIRANDATVLLSGATADTVVLPSVSMGRIIKIVRTDSLTTAHVVRGTINDAFVYIFSWPYESITLYAIAATKFVIIGGR